MQFSEIKKQASAAEKKEEVIAAVNQGSSDLRPTITVSYPMCEGKADYYVIPYASDLHIKIRKLITDELTKENEQTADNLRNWIK